jgi:hypothetical protein
MIDGLAGRHENIQTASSRALESLGALEQEAEAASGEQNPDKELLREHRQHLEDLVDQLKTFRLSGEAQEGER